MALTNGSEEWAKAVGRQARARRQRRREPWDPVPGIWAVVRLGPGP